MHLKLYLLCNHYAENEVIVSFNDIMMDIEQHPNKTTTNSMDIPH